MAGYGRNKVFCNLKWGLIASLSLILLSCNHSKFPIPHSTLEEDSTLQEDSKFHIPHSTLEEDSPLQEDSDLTSDALAWADSLINTMTLEEMVGQLVMPAVMTDDSHRSLQQIRTLCADSHIGGIVLLKGTPQAAKTLADTLRALSPIPPFVAIDAEWGLAMRLEGMTEYPRNGRIPADTDENLLFEWGQQVAHECNSLGINMVLGPVLDVVIPGVKSAGIGSRSFGSDPLRAADLGVAYSHGLESGGVMSVAKHFPGHGSADADSHKRLPSVRKSRAELDSVDLLPFRRYIDNSLSGIMTGHLYVPALDADLVPVTVSEKIQNEFLREELGFSGLIITDAMNMAGAGGKSGADAVIAGADLVLAPADTRKEVVMLLQAVADGRFPLSALRDRVRRILFHKFRFSPPS